MTPCIVSKYEYRKHRSVAAKNKFLAENCGCSTGSGPILRDGQKYQNPYTCDKFSCSCYNANDRTTPHWVKSTQWEYEFPPCQSGGSTRFYLSGPDHCKEVVKNCEPMLVERRDGSPCKPGPGEFFSGVGK